MPQFMSVLGQITNVVRQVATLALALVIMTALAEAMSFRVPYINVSNSGALPYLIAACGFALGARL
jgi:hypothetical protein